MVNTESAIPFYSQVKEDILSKVQNGELQPGFRIPSEKKLTALYGVSTITIRRAISELVEEKVLERKQGKGTFVLRRSFRRTFKSGAVGFSEICRANGMQLTTRVLCAEIMKDPPQEVLDGLELAEGSAVVHIKRVRYADNQPVVIETTDFPLRFAYLLDADLNHASLYQMIRENERDVQLITPQGTREIRLVTAGKDTAELLNVKPSSVLLSSKAVVYDKTTGKPVHTSLHIGYAQKYNFIMLG